MLLVFLAFVSGLVTILAPCIWPLLPIILATSALGKSHHRPLGITLGIMVSFVILTLLLTFAIRLFHLDPNLLRIIAVIVLIFLGISFLFPSFTTLLESGISSCTSRFARTKQYGNDFFSGFVTGLSLGVVWTPCAGPILATIVTLTALGKISLLLVAMILAYVLGAGIPLFLFAFAGQRVVSSSRFISRYTHRIQQVFGLIILLTALLIATNYDSVLQNALINMFPTLNSNLTNLGNSADVTRKINALKGVHPKSTLLRNGVLNADYPAPGLHGGTTWLNTKEPLTLAALRGKVVLVDFWTYTCINCIRTLPHLTAWYTKYKKDGFVVIGVHTPEFPFEHDTKNVQQALAMFHITYPVVQDNQETIWIDFNNEYWPAEYLIDAKGYVRRTDFGEGKYDTMERAIQLLLMQKGKKHIPTTLSTVADTTPTGQLSPETYFGSNRVMFFYPNGTYSQGTRRFTLQKMPDLDSFSLGGTWTIEPQDAVSGTNATVAYTFYAKQVYAVIRPPSGKSVTVHVYLDGKVIPKTLAGSDVVNGSISVNEDRLYHIVDLRKTPSSHTLLLKFDDPHTQLYTFTFG